MSVAWQSGRPKIPLYHNYNGVQPINLRNVSCDTPYEAITLALFSLCEVFGSTENSIVTFTLSNCPDFSMAEIQAALQSGIKDGLFMGLRPPVINWLEPQPPIRYTFSANMDRNGSNAEVVRYLIGLTGGVRSNVFRRFFRPYVDPVDRKLVGEGLNCCNR